MAQSKQKQLCNKKAIEFAFKSKLAGPIEELSLLRRSLLLAEVAMISYLSIEECNIAAGKLGFTDGKFFNCGGSQAYWFQNEWDSVVVFRGTEVDDWNDIRADANALTALAETVGKVHRGFKSEVDEIWPHIEKALEVNTKKLWFCGHSLGGAMAKICADRCMLSYIKSEPEEIHTLGSPRVGCKKYVNHVQIPHYRWVNNNDIVTRVPPILLGYRHSGTEMYLDHMGRLKKVSGWKRTADRLKGFFGGLRRGRIDHLSDHSSPEYIDNIFKAVRAEEAKNGTAPKKPAVAKNDNKQSAETDSESADSNPGESEAKQLSA
ncbi:MAG: lipase family protein [Mariniblastus sp.]